MITLPELVRGISSTLSESSETTAEDFGRDLIAAALNRSWASLNHAHHGDVELAPADVQRVHDVAERVRSGMPLAYAVGAAAFRHLMLDVDPRVLIPRPETELVVDHALRVMQGTHGGTAVDIGTGSGAIALSLAQEGAFSQVIGTDISADALDVARGNADKLASMLRAPVEFRMGADLSPVSDMEISLLISNPPYISYREAAALPASVRNWEPPTALFAADDGLARYASILRSAPSVLRRGGWIVLECDSQRADKIAELAEQVGEYENVRVYQDLTGRPRILVARRRE